MFALFTGCHIGRPRSTVLQHGGSVLSSIILRTTFDEYLNFGTTHTYTLNLQKWLLYLSSITSQFLDFIRRMVLDSVIFYCLTMHALYMNKFRSSKYQMKTMPIEKMSNRSRTDLKTRANNVLIFKFILGHYWNRLRTLANEGYENQHGCQPKLEVSEIFNQKDPSLAPGNNLQLQQVLTGWLTAFQICFPSDPHLSVFRKTRADALGIKAADVPCITDDFVQVAREIFSW